MPPEACLVHSEQKVLQVDGMGWDWLDSRASQLHFFIFISFQEGMNARHTIEQEQYRSSMLYIHNFFLRVGV